MPEVSLVECCVKAGPVPQQLCPLQHSRYGVCIAVVGTAMNLLPGEISITDLFEAD